MAFHASHTLFLFLLQSKALSEHSYGTVILNLNLSCTLLRHVATTTALHESDKTTTHCYIRKQSVPAQWIMFVHIESSLV